MYIYIYIHISLFIFRDWDILLGSCMDESVIKGLIDVRVKKNYREEKQVNRERGRKEERKDCGIEVTSRLVIVVLKKNLLIILVLKIVSWMIVS